MEGRRAGLVIEGMTNCPGSWARVYMGGKINLGLEGWKGGGC